MSTTSVKPVPTLKGMFTEAKINHRRDFLRENKLNLRELQKVVSKNKLSQQPDRQWNQQKHVHHSQQQQQQSINRRSETQHINLCVKQRSLSQQRIGKSEIQQTNFLTCKNCGNNSSKDRLGRRSASSINSKVSCDREIQTDDINDEDFLYDALKKCTSSETNVHSSTKVNLNDALQKSELNEKKLSTALNNCQENNGDGDSIGHNGRQTHQQISGESELKQNGYQHYDDNDRYSNYSTRSRINGFHNEQLIVHQQEGGGEEEELDLGNLAIDNHNNEQQRQDQPINMPISGGSRHTNVTAHSGNLTKQTPLGRNDLRLPKYLQREKREKQEQRIRELERDPNCPIGHFALTNDERLRALAMTEKKFKMLVNELNHMPMTTQTLRIRTRRAEIEKELAMLEADIRMYSKEKVYVKEFQQ